MAENNTIQKSQAKAPETVSMYEHEEEMFRLERTVVRQAHAILALIIALVIIVGGLISGFLYYESNYDTYRYSQDGGGINNINTGTQGDVLTDEPKTNDTKAQGR